MSLRPAIIKTLAIVLLFGIYIWGISTNPPGYYVDESGLSYNAYLVSTTGAGEFGSPGTLYFKIYTGGFTQYANPTHIYLLAIVFLFFGPSIMAAKLTAAVSVFGACLLLGLLAFRLTGKRAVGVIVAGLALLTPWLFEISRLVLETFFYPMATVLFLWSVYKAYKKGVWSWLNIFLIAAALALLTYSYTIGRLLGPLLALSLICFAVNRQRLLGVINTWAVYGLTLIPLVVFNLQNPEVRTRFYLLSYIKPESTWSEIIIKFLSRYLEDLNPLTMLLTGDTNARHHLMDAFGSFYIAAFVLALVGVVVIVLKHRNDAWWRFVVFGLAASAVPGALTVDKFHTLRMIAYPIFLLTLTIPALQWLLSKDEVPEDAKSGRILFPSQIRHGVVALLLVFALTEASYFHWKYFTEGGKRGYVFDSAYKVLYDTATAQTDRPIYLIDNYWGPAYIHSFWYATIEGRSIDEFVHLPYGKKAPASGVVLSTERECTNCVLIDRKGDYILYVAK